MKSYKFKKAEAIWSKERQNEMNCELAIRAVIAANKKTKLAIAAASVYRIWINGKFWAAGPARAAHNYYRVDEYNITEQLKNEENVVIAEIVGYNVNSYDTLDQESFVSAEIIQDGEVVAWTSGEGFGLFDLKQRIQRVQRYSFQRAFIDSYRLRKDRQSFYTEPEFMWSTEEIISLGQKQYLYREVDLPKFEPLKAYAISGGTVHFDDSENNNLIPEENYFQIGPTLKGYARNETEVHVSEDTQRLVCTQGIMKSELENAYLLCGFPYNATGFFHLEVEAVESSKVYILFDELMMEGDINFLRMYSCNSFYYEVEEGKYLLTSFSPYVMKYIKIIVLGHVKIKSVEFREYKNPIIIKEIPIPKKEKELRVIMNAARESYLSNSLDLFTDCPSRERAGWLCDSYFTAEVEYVLTGENRIEKLFLENYLVADQNSCIPQGMLPMCYPADHNNGMFIPNWSMWFVLELFRYMERTGDKRLVKKARGKIYSLLDYFEQFENEEGFLENLDGWVFVEWSKANDIELTQGVNFPTNMLYVSMLKKIADLYQDERVRDKANLLRKKIRQFSKKSIFYTDHLGSDIATEVCQYYAFFTGIASIDEDADLWRILVDEFGENRKDDDPYPGIAQANFFIGIYLRIELLYQNGLYEEVIQNIKDYFYPMAVATGTLWEHTQPSGSCNHGFASYVLYWLDKIYSKQILT